MRQQFKFEPTPAEISAACREIQAGWSEKEWQTRRAVSAHRHWLPPGIERICRVALYVRQIAHQ